MRASLALLSVLLAPVALASPFVPAQVQQQQNKVAADGSSGLMSYFKNALKMANLQRRAIEDDNISNAAESDASTYVSYVQDGSHIYQPADEVSLVTYVIPKSAVESFVYTISANALIPEDVPVTESARSQEPPRKVQISYDDIYFSQTESYSVPDLGSFPSDSPFIRDWPNIPSQEDPSSSSAQ